MQTRNRFTSRVGKTSLESGRQSSQLKRSSPHTSGSMMQVKIDCWRPATLTRFGDGTSMQRPLPDLNTPNHSIESLRIHRNGELAMLLRPWHGGNEWKRLNWTLEATKVHTEALHENGERPSSFGDATSTQPPTIWNSPEGSISLLARLPVSFSGRDNAQFFQAAMTTFLKTVPICFLFNRKSTSYGIGQERISTVLCRFVMPPRFFPVSDEVPATTLRAQPFWYPNGLVDGATLAWAQTPFSEWKTIPWGNAKGESIQSLEWNSNENQLAIG